MLYFLSLSQAVANNSQTGTDSFFFFNFSTISKSTVNDINNYHHLEHDKAIKILNSKYGKME